MPTGSWSTRAAWRYVPRRVLCVRGLGWQAFVRDLAGRSALSCRHVRRRLESRVQQLSWTDDMMLRAERPDTPMQIQMLLIYDQSTAPDGRVTFKRILEQIAA